MYQTPKKHKGLSIIKIKETIGINWRIAKKYADEIQLPESTIKQPTGMIYTEKWREIISAWLFEDNKLKKKLRRNKKSLFKDLQNLGFTGSFRTVCYFISDWEKAIMKKLIKGMIV